MVSNHDWDWIETLDTKATIRCSFSIYAVFLQTNKCKYNFFTNSNVANDFRETFGANEIRKTLYSKKFGEYWTTSWSAVGSWKPNLDFCQ